MGCPKVGNAKVRAEMTVLMDIYNDEKFVYSLYADESSLNDDGTIFSDEYLDNLLETGLASDYADSLEKSLFNITETGKMIGANNDFRPIKINTKRSEQAINNGIMHLYDALLRDKMSYSSVMGPLDSDFLPNIINDLYDTNNSENENNSNPFDFFSGSTQFEIKENYSMGKTGVAQSANHTADVAMAMLASMKSSSEWGVQRETATHNILYKYPDGETLDRRDSNDANNELLGIKFVKKTLQEMADSRGKGTKLSITMSALLTAYVDIAKDDYISKANLNASTFRTAVSLLREGMQKEVVIAYMMHPVINAIAKLDEESISADLYNEDRIKELESKFEKRYGAGVIEEARKLSKNDEFVPINISENIEEISKSSGKESATVEELFNEESYSALVFIASYMVFKNRSKGLKKIMDVNSVLTEGIGTGPATYMQKMHKLNVAESYESKKTANRMSSSKYGNTPLATAIKNSLYIAPSLMSGTTPAFDGQFQDLMYDIIGKRRSDEYFEETDVKKAEVAERNLFSLMYANTIDIYRNKNYMDLFEKTNDRYLGKKLIGLQSSEEYEDNSFIQSLRVDVSDKNFGYVYSTASGLDIAEKNRMTAEFDELYANEDTRQFALDLTQSLFVMSGGNSVRGGYNDVQSADILRMTSLQTNRINNILYSDRINRSLLVDTIIMNSPNKFIDKVSWGYATGKKYGYLPIDDKLSDETKLMISKSMIGKKTASDKDISDMFKVLSKMNKNKHVMLFSSKATRDSNFIKIWNKKRGMFDIYKKMKMVTVGEDINGSEYKQGIYALVDNIGYTSGKGRNIFEYNISPNNYMPMTRIDSNKMKFNGKEGYTKEQYNYFVASFAYGKNVVRDQTGEIDESVSKIEC